MAIQKQMPDHAGVPTSYHRIVALHSVVGQQTQIELAHYISADERTREKEPGGEFADIHRPVEYLNIPYDPAMSVISAYEYLKGLEEFKDSKDIFEEGQTGTLVDVTAAWEPDTPYLAGDRVMHAQAMWVVLQAHTSQPDWEPNKAPSLFAKVHDSSKGIPEWEQPQGSHDAYAKGEQVTHKSKTWESQVDANVWEPGVYGWEEV